MIIMMMMKVPRTYQAQLNYERHISQRSFNYDLKMLGTFRGFSTYLLGISTVWKWETNRLNCSRVGNLTVFRARGVGHWTDFMDPAIKQTSPLIL